MQPALTAGAARHGRWTRFAGALRGAGRVVLDAALPPLCPACRKPVADDGGLCPGCWSQLSFITPPYCEKLGTPFAYDPGPGVLSMQAIADPPAYRRARAAVRYDDVSRALIRGLKYSDRLDLAAVLGGALKRVKPTAQQVGLTASERALNVQGAFKVVDRSRVAGRRLVLIDDVLTSGATIDACARALNRAGAAAVDVLVFARVVDASRSPI